MKRKKIALIYPISNVFNNDNQTPGYRNDESLLKMMRDEKRLWACPNLSLLTIAALADDFFDVVLIDENVEKINFDEKYDLIGITAMTFQANRAYEIADKFRAKGIKVLLGGIHSTVCHARRG